jgi:hypothetical protein
VLLRAGLGLREMLRLCISPPFRRGDADRRGEIERLGLEGERLGLEGEREDERESTDRENDRLRSRPRETERGGIGNTYLKMRLQIFKEFVKCVMKEMLLQHVCPPTGILSRVANRDVYFINGSTSAKYFQYISKIYTIFSLFTSEAGHLELKWLIYIYIYDT